jgi:glycosyltransferase involved in cell wall biosynthesis
VINIDLSEIKLSIITPCFNEEEGIEFCFKETQRVMRQNFPNLTYEHLFIDNNSQDSTVSRLTELKKKSSTIRIFSNSENIGVYASIQRALKEAKGEWVVPFLAADCQDPPQIIAKMLSIQQSTNCDSVFGIRETRIESKFLLLMRRIFYFVLGVVTEKDYVPGTSEFCLIRKSAVLRILKIDDDNPFLRIYLSQLRGNCQYIKYDMGSRTAGTSSANLFKLADEALNAFSLILPSVFSRFMVIFTPLAFLGFLFSFPILVWGLVSDDRLIFFLGASGLIISFFSATWLLTMLVGHYVYIIHLQVRKKLLSETIEV